MLKLIGSLIIITASVGFAYTIRRDLAEHLRLLYEIRRMLVDISYAARDSMQPVEILLGCFIKTREEHLNAACKEIAERLIEKQEGSGEEVWKTVFGKYKKELGLRGDEAEILEGAGKAFFGKSVEENGKHLALCLERLDFIIENTRGEQKEKQKVYQTVSIMCGLMLIILLI